VYFIIGPNVRSPYDINVTDRQGRQDNGPVAQGEPLLVTIAQKAEKSASFRVRTMFKREVGYLYFSRYRSSATTQLTVSLMEWPGIYTEKQIEPFTSAVSIGHRLMTERRTPGHSINLRRIRRVK